MNKPILYILSGMSFAGKSVLAREIAKTKSIPYIDPDEVSRERGLGLNGEFIPEEIWKDIHKEAEQRAIEILKQGKSLVYDTTALIKKDRDYLRNLANENGAEPLVIIVNISREDAFKRWQENNTTNERYAVHINDFNMCADGFQFPKDDEKFIVYQAGQNITEWLRKIN
ncbi:MAG TPA: AAA family ATPase [Patescibacteria group bacterium]|jgi:predicted kinase|nr:AAA family ATPase [Patescibacteria group bacterium]